MDKTHLEQQLIDLDTSPEGLASVSGIEINIVLQDGVKVNPPGDGSKENRANVTVRNGFISKVLSWG